MKKHLSFRNASRNTITVFFKILRNWGIRLFAKLLKILIQLDIRDILGQEVVKSINEIEELGLLQADKFVSERIVK